ncbi:MAG: SAM-dependent DNA methyltransferase [Dehalococcoidia bacterium]|nr:SAM-dependent DNA methyltransferase [Dehalococcoidia bacterium]
MTAERRPNITADDPRGAQAAVEILRRHRDGALEANITSAVRNFLTITGLVQDDEVVEEAPPAEGSRQAVDLTALDTFVEFKRRIGTASGGAPHPEYVDQLDDYLAQSAKQGRVRMGVLTDGKHWLLRWPGAGEVRLTRPYSFTLEDPDRWFTLHEWLRDYALAVPKSLKPNRDEIGKHFGQGSPSYQRDIAALKAHYEENTEKETIRVKRRLWYDLLRTALGEVAYSTEGIDDAVRTVMGDRFAEDTQEMDDLFVRHTYLSAVIGMVVQASFGIDIQRLAETDPADLLLGRQLHQGTGLYGVLESDFFAWPNEVGGEPLLRTLARRVARFDWTEAPADTAATLYETVIPPEERRQLGEYYTPAWLARAMIRELVDDPLNQRVLDPACGSGTFVAEAVTHFIAAAGKTGWEPMKVLSRLREAVTGIDVHPVAVHLARAAWTLAARPAINAAGAAGHDASLSIPVYLGDALQLRFDTEGMFAQHTITIQVEDDENTELAFPRSLVERAETFDSLMGDISAYIERGDDPFLSLDDNHIDDPAERGTIEETIRAMQRLHDRGRNHIWAYYTRNMVRPVALSNSKVDVVIGNPPWINYNQTADILRDELLNLSRNRYGIWAGGRYATHQDVAGLFFARSVDRYLKDSGVIGFVLPHSALQAGQYSKWRSGQWRARKTGPSVQVDFTFKRAWDLERLEPNTFFPIPSSVVFARKLSQDASGKALSGMVERWLGKVGAENVRREKVGIIDTGAVGESPYAALSRQGAVIVPRRLFYVEETKNTAIVQAAPTVTVNPRLGNQDKAPWKNLNLTAITAQTVEAKHLFDVHLGETIAPYVTLEPLKALLPLKQGDAAIATSDRGPGGIRLGGLERRMRERWQTVSRMWEENKAPANRLNLLGQLDYMGKLSSQLEWMEDSGERPVRVVYTSAGQPTASLLQHDSVIVDYKLFWIACKDLDEANYLLAFINSDALQEAVKPLMSKGQFGARDLQKHLWKLPIPEFDPVEELHIVIAEAGATAARKAQERLARLQERYEHQEKELTVAVARRELRAWLRTSDEGRAVESAVEKLLESG